MLIDIGVNLTHPSFGKDRDTVVAAAEKAGVCPLIVTGTSIKESCGAYDYAAGLPGRCFATAGVHPHEARDCDAGTIPRLRELAQFPEVVAIGECGLDYNRDYSPRPVQREWFEKQVLLACELNMPLFLHERDAFDDFVSILEQNCPKNIKKVVHCFTGQERELFKYLELDCYIGITGWVCDERRGEHLLTLLKYIPTDRLMLETDSPFLTPRSLPYAQSRNTPANLVHIAGIVSAALSKPLTELSAETFQNSCEFFGIGRR
ncbi:MAG: TatD family hydrolase [Treponema sp.]|jgi:TatD DNase family protein|nr:TatD family hydrolase [Treponema sp.]